jgi:hypothetical protein
MVIDDISECSDQVVAVRISEPASFGTEHGTGPFMGRITAVRGVTVVVDLEEPIPFRGERIVKMVATPRHERDRFTRDSLDRSIPVTLVPVTYMDMLEIGDDFDIAASRRSWSMAGDLMLAGGRDSRLTNAARPSGR